MLSMGFSAVPTPLYVLYQQRDHFSTFMITVVYAVYAVGVVASLFLGGHISDWVGRKRVLVPALLVNVISAVIFILAPSLPDHQRRLCRADDRNRDRLPRRTTRWDIRW